MVTRTVVFVEDARGQAVDQILYCESKELSVADVGMPYGLREVLEKHDAGEIEIVLFVVDLALPGFHAEKFFDVGSVDDKSGFDAGWIVLEKILRPEDQQCRYGNIPAVILTHLELTSKAKARLNAMNERNQALGRPLVRYLQKWGTSSFLPTWAKEFEAIIDELIARLDNSHG